MQLEEFEYCLPEKLIAQEPLRKRDQARLLVVDRVSGLIKHDVFSNIDQYLPARSMMVLNDSRVISARLIGRKNEVAGRLRYFY